MKTLIKNVRILMEDTVITDHQVLIVDHKIQKIVPEKDSIDDYDTLIDGNNLYLSPGFIDIHNHGNTGYDTMDATPEALEHMADYHLHHGVTSFLAATMTNPNDKIVKAVHNVSTYMAGQKQDTSTLLGVYLEGPYFNFKKKGAQPGEDIRNPDIHELKQFISASNDTIRVVALAPELEGATDMIAFLKDNQIRIAIGHSDSDAETVRQAIESGVTIATHLYNGMRTFTHREPGIVGACLTNDALRAELIADGIHLQQIAIEIAIRCKSSDNIILISDAMRAAGLADGTYELGGQTVISENGYARLVDGTLAGSTLNLNKAVKNMVDLFGVGMVDAVKMASLNPAKAIGFDHLIGSISLGKTADLLLFDDHVNIMHIIKNGVLVKSSNRM